MSLLAPLVLQTVLCSSGALPPPSESRRFALIVGNNESLQRTDGTQDAPLRFADDDALRMFLLLKEAGAEAVLLTRFDRDTRRMASSVEPHDAPTLAAIRRSYASLADQMKAAAEVGQEVEFFFYYSGHGDVDRDEGYVALEDARLTRTELRTSIIDRSPASTNHIFVDACKAYFLVYERGSSGDRVTYARGFARQSELPSTRANTGFILSTSSSRDAHEWERFQGGVFSHQVRSALRGGADADLDGTVSYAELGAFLSRANESIPNPLFRPDYWIAPPGQNPVALEKTVLRWPTSKSTLTVDGRFVGHVYVEDTVGWRVLDVHPAHDQALTLFVPKDVPLFVRQADDQFEFQVGRRRGIALSSLPKRRAASSRRGALHLAFDQLFREPFGRKVVQDFITSSAVNIDLVPREASTVRIDVSQSVDPWPVLAWTTAGVATATGVGLTIWAQSIRGTNFSSDLDRYRASAQIRDLNIASIVAYGVGAAAAILGVVFLFDGGDNPTNMMIAPASVANETR